MGTCHAQRSSKWTSRKTCETNGFLQRFQYVSMLSHTHILDILDILVRNKFPAECFGEISDSFSLSFSLPSAVQRTVSGVPTRPGSARAQSVRTEAKVVKFSAFFWPFFVGCRRKNLWKPTEITEIMDLVTLVGHNMSLSRKCPQLI